MEINPLHLSEEELNFELNLRNITGLGLTTRRVKCTKLKDAMTVDYKEGRFYPTSTHVMDDCTNIENCEYQIKLILPAIQAALEKNDRGFLENVKSRLRHYLTRLSRVNPPPENQTEVWTSVRTSILSTLEVVTKATSANAISEVESEIVTECTQSNERIPLTTDGATGGVHAGATDQISINASIGIEKQDAPITQNRAADGLQLTQERRQMQQSTGLPTMAQANRSGLAGDPFPNPLDNRGNTMNNNTPQPPYSTPNNIHLAEYNRLRDEMLTYFLRRERVNTEGTRIPKAIHNWPFRFRGEKDITSLNTFLNRVECFAQSEGVTEEVLLKSIKHLLQDDALDWYGRAFYETSILTWSEFKNQIRREFLPSSYAQMIKIEATFRYQGANEPFAKFYREISQLFNFIDPPMSHEERFFIVKKNMNAEYASIIAAARPRGLQELVEVCSGFDETRILLNRQRRFSIPHNALLEPNYATPPQTVQRNTQSSTPLRFGRVNAIEGFQEEFMQEIEPGRGATQQPEKEVDYSQQLESLLQQVNALRVRLDRKDQPRRSSVALRPQGNMSTADPQNTVQQRLIQQSASSPRAEDNSNELSYLLCWNCDGNGHRYRDCAKPQVIFFCYGCGRKGYTMRNCPVCTGGQGNEQARSQQ